MKTKALISCAVTAQLICVFVFAYAKSRFYHNKAHTRFTLFINAFLFIKACRCLACGTGIYVTIYILYGGRTGLVVRTSDSGSGDPGSILGQVGVLFP